MKCFFVYIIYLKFKLTVTFIIPQCKNFFDVDDFKSLANINRIWSMLSNENTILFDNTDRELSVHKLKWICYKFSFLLSNYNNFNINYLDLHD
jgi:hypothetical protein